MSDSSDEEKIRSVGVIVEMRKANRRGVIIAVSYKTIFDESMSAFYKARTTQYGGLPNFSFIL